MKIYSLIKKMPLIRTIVRRFEAMECEIRNAQNELNRYKDKTRQEMKKYQEDMQKISREYKTNQREMEQKYQEQKKLIHQLEQKLAKSEFELTNFKARYGRERYQMKMDMRSNLYKALPEERYEEELKNWYLLSTGKVLDLQHPKTYNEKMQWLKLYDHDKEKTRLSDKYLVRDFVKETIGEKYLVPLLGVWKCFDEIDFSTLPDKFVLKANHGCGYNLIVKNKEELNFKEAKEKFDRWLTTNFAYVNFEMHYKDIHPVIIAEEYIENEDDDLYDYKVWCFNGEPKYIMYLNNRKNGLKMVFYDTEWNRMPFTYSVAVCEEDIPKPDNLEELLEMSKKLSKDFKHVRVDFYRLNDGSYKFGEMTFTSAAGKAIWHPEEYDRILGDMLEL